MYDHWRKLDNYWQSYDILRMCFMHGSHLLSYMTSKQELSRIVEYNIFFNTWSSFKNVPSLKEVAFNFCYNIGKVGSCFRKKNYLFLYYHHIKIKMFYFCFYMILDMYVQSKVIAPCDCWTKTEIHIFLAITLYLHGVTHYNIYIVNYCKLTVSVNRYNY